MANKNIEAVSSTPDINEVEESDINGEQRPYSLKVDV